MDEMRREINSLKEELNTMVFAKSEVERRSIELSQSLDETRTQNESHVKDLHVLNKSIDTHKKQHAEMDKELQRLWAEIEEKDTNTQRLQGDVERLRTEVAITTDALATATAVNTKTTSNNCNDNNDNSNNDNNNDQIPESEEALVHRVAFHDMAETLHEEGPNRYQAFVQSNPNPYKPVYERPSDVAIKTLMKACVDADSVLKIMFDRKEDERIAWRGCRAIFDMVVNNEEIRLLCYKEKIEEILMYYLINYAEISVVQTNGIRLIGSLAFGNDR